jgi:CRISPR-associated endonuclease/helicase Cas3
VQIIWRADLSEEEIVHVAASQHEQRRGAGAAFEALLGRIEACPPTGLEAVAVPTGAARAWLAGLRSGKPVPTAFDVSDADAVASRDEDEAEQSGLGGVALAWRGDESVLVGPADLEPGMTLVVPSEYGGLAFGTWDPSSRQPVDDLAEKGRWEQTRRPIVRLHPKVRGASEMVGAGELPRPIPDEDPDDTLARIETWLAKARSREPVGWFGEVLDRASKELRRSSVVRVDRILLDTDDEVGTPEFFVVVGRSSKKDATDISTEDDGSSSYTGIEVPLHDHMEGVRTWAGAFAVRCGLSDAVVRDLELAARWHDAGKADPRFQRWLRGGSPLADVASELLAKSRLDMSDRRVRTRARERSGYPRGARHELSSVTFMETESSLLAGAVDRDLVLHLIASHHGWCRPFAPGVDDAEPVEMTLRMGDRDVSVKSDHGLGALESGVAERFWHLVERYGWFGLAWLESILRLADHRRSELERSASSRRDRVKEEVEA